jgi:hypothetical protein
MKLTGCLGAIGPPLGEGGASRGVSWMSWLVFRGGRGEGTGVKGGDMGCLMAGLSRFVVVADTDDSEERSSSSGLYGGSVSVEGRRRASAGAC